MHGGRGELGAALLVLGKQPTLLRDPVTPGLLELWTHPKVAMTGRAAGVGWVEAEVSLSTAGPPSHEDQGPWALGLQSILTQTATLSYGDPRVVQCRGLSHKLGHPVCPAGTGRLRVAHCWMSEWAGMHVY